MGKKKVKHKKKAKHLPKKPIIIGLTLTLLIPLTSMSTIKTALGQTYTESKPLEKDGKHFGTLKLVVTPKPVTIWEAYVKNQRKIDVKLEVELNEETPSITTQISVNLLPETLPLPIQLETTATDHRGETIRRTKQVNTGFPLEDLELILEKQGIDAQYNLLDNTIEIPNTTITISQTSGVTGLGDQLDEVRRIFNHYIRGRAGSFLIQYVFDGAGKKKVLEAEITLPRNIEIDPIYIAETSSVFPPKPKTEGEGVYSPIFVNERIILPKEKKELIEKIEAEREERAEEERQRRREMGEEEGITLRIPGQEEGIPIKKETKPPKKEEEES